MLIVPHHRLPEIYFNNLEEDSLRCLQWMYERKWKIIALHIIASIGVIIFSSMSKDDSVQFTGEFLGGVGIIMDMCAMFVIQCCHPPQRDENNGEIVIDEEDDNAYQAFGDA